MQIDALAALLEQHHHGYDSDCGTDFGCSCREITDYDETDVSPGEHVAGVIRAAFTVAARGSSEHD